MCSFRAVVGVGAHQAGQPLNLYFVHDNFGKTKLNANSHQNQNQHNFLFPALIGKRFFSSRKEREKKNESIKDFFGPKKIIKETAQVRLLGPTPRRNQSPDERHHVARFFSMINPMTTSRAPFVRRSSPSTFCLIFSIEINQLKIKEDKIFSNKIEKDTIGWLWV